MTAADRIARHRTRSGAGRASPALTSRGLPDRDVGRAAAVEALGRHDLVVPAGPHRHALARPSVDVIAERDVAVHPRAPLRLTDAEVLPERRRAVDGRL